jgi:sulfite dehydrogenase (cytochrome) subunit B
MSTPRVMATAGMTSRAAALAVTALVCGAAAVQAKPVSYDLPEEMAAFRPGPNLEAVQNNCTACHSADYIQTQPEGPKFKKGFWQAEVTKMIKVYGAPIDDADVGKIVEYLTQTY